MKNFKNLIFIFANLLLLTVNALAFEDSDVRKAIKQVGGVEKFVKQMAETMAKNTPQQLDKETSLISVLSNGDTINLTHLVSSQKSKEIIQDKKLVEYFKNFQTEKLCSSQVSKILIIEFGVTYHYQYVSPKGSNLFVFDVRKKNCVK